MVKPDSLLWYSPKREGKIHQSRGLLIVGPTFFHFVCGSKKKSQLTLIWLVGMPGHLGAVCSWGLLPRVGCGFLKQHLLLDSVNVV